MTAFLLLFCIAAGLAIANYDVLKTAYYEEHSEERVLLMEKWNTIQEMLQKLLDKLPQMEEHGSDFNLIIENLRTETKAELDHIKAELSDLKGDVKAIKERLEFFFEEKQPEEEIK